MKLGWITSEYPTRPSWRAVWLRSAAMLTMRTRNMMLALNQYGVRSSFFQPDKDYDAVIVIKTFHDAARDAVKDLRRRGIPVIFDANVNYYYIWGDYTDPRTQPTPQLQHDALEMTRLADHVVADSEYLAHVLRDFHPDVTQIPDNVWPLLFRPRQPRTQSGKLRLIWSGIDFKADELLLIKEALVQVDGLELWLVTNARPSVLDTLNACLPTRWFRYSDYTYGWWLGKADAIISPRQLNNGYNLGHTEYKITLGMARCLPAVVSPQPSYLRALSKRPSGIVCYTIEDWIQAFCTLRDNGEQRARLGTNARHTVEHHYLTPVVAGQLARVIKNVLRKKD